jgi:hypothetical protein
MAELADSVRFAVSLILAATAMFAFLLLIESAVYVVELAAALVALAVGLMGEAMVAIGPAEAMLALVGLMAGLSLLTRLVRHVAGS